MYQHKIAPNIPQTDKPEWQLVGRTFRLEDRTWANVEATISLGSFC